MRVAIIGAGITGLTAAYHLSQKGHRVTVFEKESYPGGLAAGFKPASPAAGEENWGWQLENFFHHLFISDKAAKKLITELGLSNQLFYLRVRTSTFINGETYPFDSPLDVLRFPLLSWGQRLRMGVVTAYLKATSNWHQLERTTAQEWLTKFYGEKIYQLIWQPLLQAKFSSKADQISMAWFWARIKKRSSKLGYLEGGFQTLIDKLVEKIKENQGKICLNSHIRCLNDSNHLSNYDKVIFTMPTSSFAKIIPSLPKSYKTRLEEMEMIGALNLILVLKQKFLTDGTYWLNINESNFPFVAVVEHTNFVNPSHYGGNHLVYVGGYYPQTHRYFKMTKKQILNEFLPYLKKINPGFNQLSILNSQLSTNLHAQPIIPTNYSQIIPQMKTPLPNIFLANMQMVYPWDRGVNYAIELGEKVARLIG